MMRPYKITAATSLTIPIAVGSVAAVAAATSLGYIYLRNRKKRTQTNSSISKNVAELPNGNSQTEIQAASGDD